MNLGQRLTAWQPVNRRHTATIFLGEIIIIIYPFIVHLKIAVFQVIALCSLIEVCRRFRGACCLHHRGGVYLMMEAAVIYDVRKLLPDQTQQPKRQPSSML
jgi:hypothetical protein